MRTIRTIAEMRAYLQNARAQGRSIGLVPTMGAFHAGHHSLMHAARENQDEVVVSLFVNPAQFNDAADLVAYPRTEEQDAAEAADLGVDVLFAPPDSEIYPPGFATSVQVRGLSEILEGAERGANHFAGVCTVVTKLLNIVQPDVAYFGQKDAQQLAVVRRMVRDLHLDVELRVVPTVRDEDGLALSSRNVLLSPEERRRALALPRALETRDPARARELLDGVAVDYVEVADFEPRVLAAAIRVGGTRLIDNVVLEGDAG
jgi:pantoate--beta-alanine ligase